MQSQAFDAVISMCSERILERLGVHDLPAAHGKVRKPIKAPLITAVDYLKTSRRVRRLREAAEGVVQGLRRIIRAIDAWSNHRVLPELRAVLDAGYDLSNIRGWDSIIASIPNRILSPTQRDKIVDVVTKIARYREVARYLYRTAKKFPIARNIRVVTVDLAPAAFGKTQLGGHDPQVDAFFQKFRQNKLKFARLCRLLSVSETDAQSSFRQNTEDILGVSRIHAEVQLLVYCDLELAGPRPRVICSRKAACFLCNQLIKAHGKVYTPYCHGKLYTPWRLPKLGGGELSRRLSSTLEQFTRDSLEEMRRRGARVKHPPPTGESATHTLLSSLTTLAGPASAVAEQLGRDVGINAPAAVEELPTTP